MTPATDPGSKGSAAQDVSNIDYSGQSHSELISRITSLERQLREQTDLLTTLTNANKTNQSLTATRPETQIPPQTSPLPSRRRSRSRSPRRARPFNPSLYSTRHIALKFAYLGPRYGGYEHANGNITPQPTIEEILWKALRKARLISPELREGADEGFDVVRGERERRGRYVKGDKVAQEGYERVRLDLNWEGCQYSKCGRTDRGVSAFGQVIGIRVRSNRPIETKEEEEAESTTTEAPSQENGNTKILLERTPEEDEMPAIDTAYLSSEPYKKPFDPVKDELPYISLLNAILPADIRILAWCPTPPPNFDARFSCRERRYKYFFTNPAFCPTPGPLGLLRGDGQGPADVREGWLDVDKMKEAAKKLEGLHDFRNFCKIDASKQMPNCIRRVTFADVVEWEESGRAFGEHEGLKQHGSSSFVDSILGNGVLRATPGGPRVYTFCVHGTAFLWHQVRCMVAVLFLIGQGLEQPSIIDELLDVEKNPGRPMYEMADDAPLVLWDCMFPDKEAENGEEMKDSLDWLYAGDEATISSLTTNSTKNDGKFGIGAVVDELWTQWRNAKMQEILAGSLLDLAISHGDGTSFQRSATRDGPRSIGIRSQKAFDGSGRARIQGRYVPVMKKPRMDSLEVLNAKWLKSRNARQAETEAQVKGRKFEETNADVE